LPTFQEIFSGFPYLALLGSVLVLSYFARKYDIFQPLYFFIAGKVESKRAVVALTSAITGVLPIEGRVTVSAGILSTMAPSDDRRKKYGVLDYLATHHFYFWSPIEKTVIVPMAVLGISYWNFLAHIWPMLITMIAATLFYIFVTLKEEDVEINVRTERESQKMDAVKEIYDGAKTMSLVAIILVLGSIAKFYSSEFESLVESAQSFGWTSVVLASLFVGGFVLGSSSKYAGLLAVTLPVYGVGYLPMLFTAAWAGYMLSPTHKCMLLGKRWFGSNFSDYYRVVGGVVGLVFLVSVAMTMAITL